MNDIELQHQLNTVSFKLDAVQRRLQRLKEQEAGLIKRRDVLAAKLSEQKQLTLPHVP